VGLLVLGGGVTWRLVSKGSQENQMKAGAKGGRTPAVGVDLAGPKEIISQLDVIGSLQSPNKVLLSPKTSGKIEFLEVRPGDAVQAGQAVVRIDPTDAKAQLLQAQANLAAAKSRLAQAKLQEGPANASVAGQVANTGADVTTASAQLEQSQKNGISQVAQANAQLQDATSKVAAAESAVQSAQAVLSREQANYANAKANYDRIHDLYTQNFVAAQDVDNAQTAMKAQAETVSVARAALVSAQRAKESAVAQRQVASKNVSIVQQTTHAANVSAQAKVDQSKTSLKVAQANLSQNPAYKENLAALSAAVHVAEAQVAAAQSVLSQTVLSAPISGTVTDRNGDPGSLATPGQAVVVIQQIDSLFFSAQLPIEKSGLIPEGATATLTLDGALGREIPATVAHVSLSGDNSTRQFTVLLKVDNADKSLRPGMFGRMKLVTQQVHADVAVPKEAIKNGPKGITVGVVGDDNKVSVRAVTLGETDGTFVQIKEGVKPGEKVIVLSQMPPKNGQTVTLPKPDGGKSGKPGAKRA